MNLFKHDEVRHVFRPTHVYGKFLEASTHPDYLTAGDKREQLFDYMWMLAKQSEKANVFIPDEIVDLLLHDIPYFTFYAGALPAQFKREESEGFMKHQVLIWQRKNSIFLGKGFESSAPLYFFINGDVD